jgi:glycosyltransferase involved in cell wall biosynthesis
VKHGLRIAYVYRDFNRSGSIPSIFRDRAERLARDEELVALCSSASREPTDAPIRFETVEPVVRSRARLGYAVECGSFALRAARTLRRLRAQLDVIHVVGFDAPVADLVTVNAVRRAELDHYFDQNEPDARVRRKLAPLLRPQTFVVLEMERRLFRDPYPYCIAETDAVGRDLTRHYGVPEDAIETIPAGIDAGRLQFDAQARASIRLKLGVPEMRFVTLFVGDDFGRKGLERAIRAIALVEGAHELWVAGRGDPQRFEALAHSLGISERVRFLGRVHPDLLPEIYSGCDALVLPSRQDAWGNPVVEAMAAGRVALASEFTGSHTVIRDGVSGYVLDRDGPPAQIAAVLGSTAADPDLARSIGRNAVHAAAEHDRDSLYPRLREAHHKAFERRLARSKAASASRGL